MDYDLDIAADEIGERSNQDNTSWTILTPLKHRTSLQQPRLYLF